MNIKSFQFVVTVLLHFTFCSGQLNIHNLLVGDECIIQKDYSMGTCKLLKNCPSVASNWKYVDDSNRPTICGFENRSPIICCPNASPTKLRDPVSTLENKYYAFNETCIDVQTNEIGIISKIRDCPYAMEQLKKNILLPKVCPYDVCSDLVCCIRAKCVQDINCLHSSIETIIRNRLESNFECKVSEIETGIYTISDSCSFYDDLRINNIILPKSCDWNFCEKFVCCPKTHLNNTVCTNRGNIQLVAGPCTTLGSTGICTTANQCSYNFKSNEKQICGQNCGETLYCCPEPSDVEKLPRYARACVAYRSAFFDDTKNIKLLPKEIDDMRDPLVYYFAIGGQYADPKEFPHMTVLGYDVKNEIEWNCGGSLISDQFILTAAHCLFATDSNPVKYAKIGIIDLETTECLCSKTFNIIDRIPHPNYNTRSNYDDIGLLKLDRKIRFRTHIRPICLPTTPDIPGKLKAIGFGETSHDGEKSNRLIKVDLDFFSHRECNESYKFNFNRRFSGINDNIQFCAGSKETIMDTCRGDSGGPIQADHPEYHKIAIIYGVTSFGRACGFVGQPAIYTTVYPYISWIEKIVWPE